MPLDKAGGGNQTWSQAFNRTVLTPHGNGTNSIIFHSGESSIVSLHYKQSDSLDSVRKRKSMELVANSGAYRLDYGGSMLL